MYKAFPYEKTSVRTKLYKCFYVFISYRERISFISDAAPRRLTSKCACGRVLFKSQLLTLGYDFVLDIDLWVPTSFLATEVRWTLHEHLLFQRRLCCQGVAVMSKQKKEGEAITSPSFVLPAQFRGKI